MNRRQLTFVVLVNALVSLVIALGVAWVIEARRPDLEELAAIYTPAPAPILAAPAAALPTETAGVAEQPTATPVALASTGAGSQQAYVVETGDSLLSIAGKFGVTVEAIVAANGLANPDFVFSGQRLQIPARGAAAAPLETAPLETAPTETALPTPASAGQGMQIARIEGAGDLVSEQALIVNESNAAVNLQGWRFERDGGPEYTFGNAPLFPGSSLRIHSAAGVDTSIDLYWAQAQPIWQSGATARLLDSQDRVVATYAVP